MAIQRLNIVFVILLECLLHQALRGQTYIEAGNLLQDVLSDYHKELKPLQNQSNFLKVTIFVSVHSIPEVNFVKGFISITFSTICYWEDEKISWTPSNYGGKEYILINLNQIWTPKVSTGMEYTVIGNNDQRIRYTHDGQAMWTPSDIVKNVCMFHVKYWPFDKQICYLAFSPINYKTNELQLDIIGKGIDASEIIIFEWTIEETFGRTYVFDNTSFVIYFLKLKRKPAFYILTIIIPMTLVNVLAPFVFLLPCASGERIGFSITILLSITVFVSVISEEIPRTADPIALICGYVMSLTVSSIMICIAVILNLKLFHKSGGKITVSPLLTRLFKSMVNKRVQIEEGKIELDKRETQTVRPVAKEAFVSDVDGHNISIERESKEINNEEVMTWQDISMSIDKLLFIMSLTTVSISSVTFLIYLQTASDYLGEAF